jgi:putative colanic acid biosynthesis acetyltransferase WcaF
VQPDGDAVTQGGRSDILDASQSQSTLGGASFTVSNRAYRALWGVAWLLFARWTPPPLHRWRVFLLRAFGARLARTAHVYPDVQVWSPRNLTMGDFACLGRAVRCYNVAAVIVAEHALVSQGAYLCTASHDFEDPGFQLTAAPITINAKAWIAAEAFVGPGVTVHEGALLGARGVTVRDLKAWTIYAGNPARAIRLRAVREV